MYVGIQILKSSPEKRGSRVGNKKPWFISRWLINLWSHPACPTFWRAFVLPGYQATRGAEGGRGGCGGWCEREGRRGKQDDAAGGVRGRRRSIRQTDGAVCCVAEQLYEYPSLYYVIVLWFEIQGTHTVTRPVHITHTLAPARQYSLQPLLPRACGKTGIYTDAHSKSFDVVIYAIKRDT